MVEWDRVVDECGPLVWRTAYRLLRNEADAADCYQDAFAAAVKVAGREPVRNWPALLQRLALTHALDRLRGRLRHTTRQDKVVDLNAVAAADPGPAQSASGRELLGVVYAALSELPEMQVQAFWMTCVDGLSYQEAAARLDVEPNYLGVLVHRGRAQLRELLAPAVAPAER